jgi:AraC-like DNA-binding protein
LELVDIMRVARSTRPALMAEAHIHSEVEVNLVTEGSMTYLFGGHSLTLTAGELGVFWGTVPHRTIALAEPTSYVCLYLPISGFLAIPAGEAFRKAVLSGHLLVADGVDQLDRSLFQRWHRDLEEPDPRRRELVRDELMARLRRVDMEGWRDLSSTAAAEPPPEARRLAKAQRMASFIAQHLAEDLHMREIAGAVHLHPNYAMRLFKDCLGLTVRQYVIRQRLSHAQAMLLSSDRDVTGIAFDCGFGSLSRFYEAFQAAFRTTPRDFRQRHRSSHGI